MARNHTDYYRKLQDISGRLADGIPGPMKAFTRLHQKATIGGALDSKIKELIALGIAVTVRCNGCISFHVHDALEAGATEDEIMETIGVAILMGGGPAMVYGCEALEALDQFRAQQAAVA